MELLDTIVDIAKTTGRIAGTLFGLVKDVAGEIQSGAHRTHTPLKVWNSGDTPIAPYETASDFFYEGDKE